MRGGTADRARRTTSRAPSRSPLTLRTSNLSNARDGNGTWADRCGLLSAPRLVSFYESDCQGRPPPSLIARFLQLWQSAPPRSPPRARLRGAPGPAGQSSSAFVTSSLGSGSDVGIRQALGPHKGADHGSI